jgi:hypothetical protein
MVPYLSIIAISFLHCFVTDLGLTSWQSDVAELIISTEVESGQPTANHVRAGIRRGTLTIWAVMAVLATIAIGAVLALLPHAR